MLESPAEAKSADRLVRSLSLAIFLQWLGASAILPLLPLYLRQKGGSDQLVGVVMGAYFVASLVSQYPAGRLADRVGRRTVLLGGLVIYAVGSMGFLLSVGPGGDIALRALQGCGAGCAEVAALAMVAGAVPLGRRGRAFGSIYRGQLGGMAIGPLVGSLIGVGSMNAIFVGAGLAAFAACVPVLTGRDLAHHGARADEADRPDRTGFPALNRALIGSVVAGVALGLTIGVYEACWTLLLDFRGAAAWQVGLSWTLFAAPFALMARPGGWIADHLDRRKIVIGTVLLTLGFCALYPWLGSIAWLLGLGAAEACGVAIALPSIQSLLTQGSDPSELGRVQGIFATAETAAIALAAMVSGLLFATRVWAPFMAAAVVGGLLVATLPVVWAPVRGRVPGRPVDPEGPDPMTR
jgi:DHA1 family multidrug resistance protein-like MFS transporter